MSKSRKSSSNQTGDEAILGGGGGHRVTPQEGISQEAPRVEQMRPPGEMRV